LLTFIAMVTACEDIIFLRHCVTFNTSPSPFLSLSSDLGAVVEFHDKINFRNSPFHLYFKQLVYKIDESKIVATLPDARYAKCVKNHCIVTLLGPQRYSQ
jgi:hypothetical protein